MWKQTLLIAFCLRSFMSRSHSAILVATFVVLVMMLIFSWASTGEPSSAQISPTSPKPPPTTQLPHQAPSKIKGILLLTQGRSGSTLLGQIIQLYPEIFYLFEPREKKWSIENRKYVSCENMMPYFNCSFLYADLASLRASFWAQHLTSLKNIDPSFQLLSKNFTKAQDNVYEVCAQKTVAIKTIGRCIALPPSIINDKSNYRIIHLIRDPRAVMHSRLKIKWTHSTDLRRHSKEMCEKVMNKAKLPVPKLTIIYEDLVQNPFQIATKVHEYIGWAGTEQESSTKRYIKKHMTNAKSEAYAFSTYKNATVMDAWTRNLTQEDRNIIESECKEVLRVYYKVV